MLLCCRHPQAKQVLDRVTDDDQRCQDNRNSAPPAKRQIDQHVFPEHLMDTRLAEPTFCGLRQSKEEQSNVSVKADASRRGFCTTSLTGHGHDLPRKRSVKRTGFLIFQWQAKVSPRRQ